MTHTTPLIRYSLLVLAFTGTFAFGDDDRPVTKKIQRYALLIGADDYAPPLSKLQYCYNDMSDLRAHLEIAGFAPDNITFMNDRDGSSRMHPTKANILRELALRLQLANKDDIVLVAFSGHGVHIDGQSYLCPTDANLDGTASLVEINDIYRMMEKCAAGEKLLIVDACRNEPIVRGFKAGKLADDLALLVQAPPRGLIVMSSCEPQQLSAEDPTLQHGVFMNYVIEGLEGPADTNEQIGGNSNGRISLDELYYYAHEKTKIHVAKSHGIVQRPMMRGEMVGRFDLATVPTETQVRNVVRREKHQPVEVATATPLPSKPQADFGLQAKEKMVEEPVKEESIKEEPVKQESKKEVVIKEEPTKSVESPLLKQADTYLQDADFDNAIEAYTTIINDRSVDVAVVREARKGRGAAYLSRGGKSDIDKALIDQLAAGLPGIQLTVRVPTAELKVNGDVVKGKVKQNQSVIVSKVVGDWLWVNSVDGSDKLQGFIAKSAVLEQPAATPVPVATPQPVLSQGDDGFQEYGQSGYRPQYQQPRGGYGQQNHQDQSPRSNWLPRLILGGSSSRSGGGWGGGSGRSR